jgi:hypothetical protein
MFSLHKALSSNPCNEKEKEKRDNQTHLNIDWLLGILVS